MEEMSNSLRTITLILVEKKNEESREMDGPRLEYSNQVRENDSVAFARPISQKGGDRQPRSKAV